MAQAGLMLVLFLNVCIDFTLVHCFRNVGVTYTINLNVYSGREDPAWKIDSTDRNYREIARAVGNGRSTDIDDDLGYCGFTVMGKNFFGEQMWKTIRKNSDPVTEKLLLNSCNNKAVSLAVHNHVQSKLDRHIIVRVPVFVTGSDDKKKRKKRQASRSCSARFEPRYWNRRPVQRRNNCYNYATNIRTDSFAQPGRASGRKFRRMEARNVYAAAIRDGLTPLSFPEVRGECLIALVIWPGEDFHFYRRDSNGYWSHKAGRTPARKYDDSGRRIRDPMVADRGPYTVFAGWLGVNKNYVDLI